MASHNAKSAELGPRFLTKVASVVSNCLGAELNFNKRSSRLAVAESQLALTEAKLILLRIKFLNINDAY